MGFSNLDGDLISNQDIWSMGRGSLKHIYGCLRYVILLSLKRKRLCSSSANKSISHRSFNTGYVGRHHSLDMKIY